MTSTLSDCKSLFPQEFLKCSVARRFVELAHMAAKL